MASLVHFLRGNKPEWLYEYLPHLYFFAGLVAIDVLRGPLAWFSGGLLIGASVVVWVMRRRYRSMPEVRADLNDASDGVGLIRLVWRPSFSSGHTMLDEQHQALFASANSLISDIVQRRPKTSLESAVYHLIRDIEIHFQSEEAVLEQCGCADLPAHRKVHEKLLHEFCDLASRFEKGQATTRDLVGFLVDDVIATHLAVQDSEFFPALKGRKNRLQ